MGIGIQPMIFYFLLSTRWSHGPNQLQTLGLNIPGMGSTPNMNRDNRHAGCHSPPHRPPTYLLVLQQTLIAASIVRHLRFLSDRICSEVGFTIFFIRDHLVQVFLHQCLGVDGLFQKAPPGRLGWPE